MASYTPISKHHSKRQLPIAPTGHLPNYGQMSRDSPPSSSYQNSPSGSQRGSYASSVPMMQKAPPHLQHRQAGLPQNSSTHMYNSGNPSQIDHGKQQPPPLPPYRPPPTQHYRGPPVPMQNIGLPTPSDYGLPTPRQGVFHPPPNAYMQSNTGIPANPFEAVGLPSLTSYNSGGQIVNSAMPPLPARNRESIDSGNAYYSRSSSSMSVQGATVQPGQTIQHPNYQRQQSHPPSRSHYDQAQLHSGHQQQQYARSNNSGGLGNHSMAHGNQSSSQLQHMQQQQLSQPPPLPSRNGNTAMGALSKNQSLSMHSSQSSIATRSSHGDPVSRKSSNETEINKGTAKEMYSNPSEVPMGNLHNNFELDPNIQNTQLEPQSIDDQSSGIKSDSIDLQSLQSIEQQRELQQQISVKERTKTFNRMASQVELDSGRTACSGENLSSTMNGMAAGIDESSTMSGVGSATNSSAFSANSSVKRRNSRAAGPMSSLPGERQSRASSTIRGDENETSSISTLDQTAKQWMVKASQGDYHSLAKMLKDDPRLAKHKDFVSGYTALHWVK